MNQRAKHGFLRQFALLGVDTIYGNPGTFEQGFLDALGEVPEIRYILGLQEAAVLAMATNAARIERRPAVVQLHAGVGLGNAMGALQETLRGKVPLLIYCGENERAFERNDGYLACDLVALGRPATKWAVRVESADRLFSTTREAWARANTPPRGPVLLSIPLDVLEQTIDDTPLAADPAIALPSPDARSVDEIADALAAAHRPLIVVGDDAAWSGALDLTLGIAERVGAMVYGLGLNMVGNRLAHPRFGGLLRYVSGHEVAAVTREADVVVTVGATLGCEIFPAPAADYLAPGAQLYQVDSDASEIGKNVEPRMGLHADPSSVFLAIGDRVRTLSRGAPRAEPWRVAVRGDTSTDRWSARLMMETVARSLPPRAYVADESMTSAGYLREALRDRPDVDYLSCLSRGLGSGWPGGIAAKRAFPDRPVVAISADGAAMYVAQALWTAAHEKLDVVFVVANNRAYRILKLNLAAHRKRFGEPSGPFPFMDLGDPPIRFDDLARSMGVAGHRAIDASSLGSALAVAFAASGSHLIDVEIPGDIDG